MLALKKTQSSEPQQTTKNKPRVSVFVDLPNDKWEKGHTVTLLQPFLANAQNLWKANSEISL